MCYTIFILKNSKIGGNYDDDENLYDERLYLYLSDRPRVAFGILSQGLFFRCTSDQGVFFCWLKKAFLLLNVSSCTLSGAFLFC